MPDEPSNADLAWRLDDVRDKLRDLIGRAEYNAHQQAADHRFAELGSDVQELHRQHDKDVQALHTRLDNHEKDGKANRQSWRGILYTGIIPAALVGVGILVQLWISKGVHK